MFWTLTPAPRRPSMSRTNYDESFYYSAARLDALDRRHARANEYMGTSDDHPSVHLLTTT